MRPPPGAGRCLGAALLAAGLLAACSGGDGEGGGPDVGADAGLLADAGGADAGLAADCPRPDGGTAADPFADRIIAFEAGAGAGFGQPCDLLGPPRGEGTFQGSLHVLTLGREGHVVLEFTDVGAVDGPGVDLLVFENPLRGFEEPGIVEVSGDGVSFHAFPCAATERDAGYPGCAGVRSVFSHPDNGLSATDPAVAGGDGFDLGLLADMPTPRRVRFVRIRDSGLGPSFGGNTVGFDLDALAVVNGEPVSGWGR